MYKIAQYKETDKMCDLICDNYQILLVVSIFNITLGFGENTIKEVCERNNVNTKTFIAISNLLIDEDEEFHHTPKNLSIESLIKYLKDSHHYFTVYRLPLIKEKLYTAINFNENNSIATLIMKYFDEYVAEVEKHTSYEDKIVFPYINDLLKGESKNEYSIDVFSQQHTNIDEKLSELKNIIIKYYVTKGSNELNSVLFDIFTCAHDLASHNLVEDKLLVPNITELEK